MEALGIKLALLALTFGLGFVVVAYPDYADRMGWPVGAWFRSDSSLIKIWGVLAVIAAPVAAIFILPWWTAVIVVIGGFALGYMITRLFRRLVQVIALIGLPILWTIDILYVLP